MKQSRNTFISLLFLCTDWNMEKWKSRVLISEASAFNELTFAKLREEVSEMFRRKLRCLKTIEHVASCFPCPTPVAAVGTVLPGKDSGHWCLVSSPFGRYYPGCQGCARSMLLLLWGDCQDGCQLGITLVKQIRISTAPLVTKSPSRGPLVQAGSSEPAAGKLCYREGCFSGEP